MTPAETEIGIGARAEGQSAADPVRLDDPLDDAPLERLAAWIEEARGHPSIRNADAMALATVDAKGDPRVRFVLCRGRGGAGRRGPHNTNQRRAPGGGLARPPPASGAFYWDPLGRQARLSGPIVRATAAESDAYFAGRHPLSQLSAWASEQSAPIASRAELEARRDAARRTHGDGTRRPIPRPPHWGGYHLLIERVELWVEGVGRLHDRAEWCRRSLEGESLLWEGRRLQP